MQGLKVQRSKRHGLKVPGFKLQGGCSECGLCFALQHGGFCEAWPLHDHTCCRPPCFFFKILGHTIASEFVGLCPETVTANRHDKAFHVEAVAFIP